MHEVAGSWALAGSECYGDYMSGGTVQALSSLLLRFLLFDRAAGFLPPRPQISNAGARRSCQGRPSLCHRGTLRRLQAAALTASSTAADWMIAAGRTLGCRVSLPTSSLFASGLVVCGSSVNVHVACDDRISLYPAAPFRLATLLHAWTIAQVGRGSSLTR